MAQTDGWRSDGEQGSRCHDSIEELLARAQDAQIRMQAQLMIERLERHLQKHAAYHQWCREREREAGERPVSE